MIFWYCIIKTIPHQSEERGFGHVERESHFALMILIDNTKNDTKNAFSLTLFFTQSCKLVPEISLPCKFSDIVGCDFVRYHTRQKRKFNQHTKCNKHLNHKTRLVLCRSQHHQRK